MRRSVGVTLVAFAAALWGFDQWIRASLKGSVSAGTIVFGEHVVLAALTLLAVAFGIDPILAIYGLFAAPMLGGVTDAVSRLVYYRIG